MSRLLIRKSGISPLLPEVTRCIHCGETCDAGIVLHEGRAFCCAGCKTVYEILAEHDLCEYYAREENAGVSMKRRTGREDEFAVLDDAVVARKLLTYSSPNLNRIVWTVPAIHCTSCVWLLERFNHIQSGILASTVDVMRKTVTIDYDPSAVSLREIAERMASIAYTPLLRLEGDVQQEHRSTRGLYSRIGIAGFAAGNTMMMYIAQYFAGPHGIDPTLATGFKIISIALSLPVLLYCASPWFVAARAALQGRKINLDVPVALGITVLFLRSIFDIATGHGEGYLDSFNGLVFFLLIGRLFQQKAFDALSFDRTYRSFFPLSVRAKTAHPNPLPKEETEFRILPIENVKIGDELEVRNGEVVPCDSILESEIGYVDYSFVTGESVPIECTKGEIIYAGGKVMGRALCMIAAKNVSHSELAAMWDRSSSRTPRTSYLKMSNRFGQWFTGIAITVAVAGALLWLPDWQKAFSIFTAVLIIACPCALTLAAPITLGSAMGRLGRFGIYLKNMGVLIELDRVTRIVFDKTGTLTDAKHSIEFFGRGVSSSEWSAILTIAKESIHPLSRAIVGANAAPNASIEYVNETVGKGIEGFAMGHSIALGSLEFVKQHCTVDMEELPQAMSTAVAIDGEFAGAFVVRSSLRKDVHRMIASLQDKRLVELLSGDSERDKQLLEPLFGTDNMRFGCRPEAKIEHVNLARAKGETVLMVGDGLNDAGAMGAADAAIAVTDDTATLVPACDVIMRADALPKLSRLLRYARQMRRVILTSLIFSICYNALGLTLAIMGLLSPLVAAILMPVSSLTVIGISVGGARHYANKLPLLFKEGAGGWS